MSQTRQRRRAAAEALESRVLLHVEPFDPDGFGPMPSAPGEPAAFTVAGAAANIRVTDAYLVDRNFNRLTRASIEGQSYGVRVEFTTIELPAGASYGVNFEVNGVTMVGITRTFGAGQTLGTWWVGRATMFANKGLHNVRVTVDPTDTVAESDETDNAAQFSFTPAPGRPPKEFALPIEGTPAVDWAISGYPDRDPRADLFADHLGRGYTYDGHRGTDLAIADMAAMDEGVDVYAAADGTVAAVHDGEFDRQIEWLDPAPPANYVTIDHGGGWQTDYWHLRAGSVAVSPGQMVTAGQKIGEVGSSGVSSGAHLHFQPRYYNEWVDPFIDPETYWLEPPAFAGDTPGVFAFTTTDHELSTSEAREHISQRHVFHPGDRVYGYVNWHGINKEPTRTNRFFRPDGSQHAVIGGNPGTADLGKAFRFAFMTLPADAPPGEWQVNIELGGVEMARTRFLVAERSEGRPEIQVLLGSNYIIDGRTTQVDFGTVARGTGPVARVFAVRNHGGVPLTVSGISLPAGFSTPRAWPVVVPSLGEALIPVHLSDQIAGPWAGRITIHSDDADQGELDFPVKGVVTGIPSSVAGRQVFYNNSALDGGDAGAGDSDDAAIAHGKHALLPGATAAIEHVTSYARGINGVMIDLLNLPGDRSPRLADVLLAAGDGRGAWAALAPVGPPATRRGAGSGGSDRVTVILPDGAVRNRWLRVTLLPSAYTGLSAPDVFYFGHLSGDTGNDRGAPTVDATDLALTRRAAGRTDTASIDRYDFNRDGVIGGADVLVVRHNLRRGLPLVTAPVAAAQNPDDLALPAVPLRTARPPRRGVLEDPVAGLLA